MDESPMDKLVPPQSGIPIMPPSKAGWILSDVEKNKARGQHVQTMSINGFKLILVASTPECHMLQHKEGMDTTSGLQDTCCSMAATNYTSCTTENMGSLTTR